MPPVPRIASSVYAIAVYNLAGHILVETAMDNPDAEPPPDNAPTFWADLRKSLGVGAAVYGIVQSSSDQGTSSSLMIPDVIKNMSLMDLDLMTSPWGRRYLQIAGQWGTIWGIS
jgi:hypothetical protein